MHVHRYLNTNTLTSSRMSLSGSQGCIKYKHDDVIVTLLESGVELPVFVS